LSLGADSQTLMREGIPRGDDREARARELDRIVERAVRLEDRRQ